MLRRVAAGKRTSGRCSAQLQQIGYHTTQDSTPKSKRIVTIPPFLAEELREYMSHLYGIMVDERMFRFTKSYMEHEIIRGIKASGVKRIRLHDLRHPYVKHTTKINSGTQQSQAVRS